MCIRDRSKSHWRLVAKYWSRTPLGSVRWPLRAARSSPSTERHGALASTLSAAAQQLCGPARM
eukprot:15080346-Alexandrium_andersonii.AAC.1